MILSNVSLYSDSISESYNQDPTCPEKPSEDYDLGNNFGVYAEYFSDWQVQGTQLFGTPYLDGGFTRLLSNDLQLDVYAGFDLSPYVNTRLNTSGLFFGAGVSYRLPLAQHLR